MSLKGIVKFSFGTPELNVGFDSIAPQRRETLPYIAQSRLLRIRKNLPERSVVILDRDLKRFPIIIHSSDPLKTPKLKPKKPENGCKIRFIANLIIWSSGKFLEGGFIDRVKTRMRDPANPSPEVPASVGVREEKGTSNEWEKDRTNTILRSYVTLFSVGPTQ